MNIFKRLSGHLYFIYALLLFAITMLIVVIPIIITNFVFRDNERKRLGAAYAIFVVWMNIYMLLVFCPVKRKGREHFRKGENYVVVVNHSSLADIPISSPWVPGPNKTLAKIEFMRIPVFNIIYRAGSILVDRKSEESRKQSTIKMVKTLEEGIHLTLYPEGTRNKTDQPLQKFYDGAFRTAILAQKDVIPGILFNTKKVLPDVPKFWAWPHVIRFEFLPAVSTAGLKVGDTLMLRQKVHDMMEKYIIAHR